MSETTQPGAPAPTIPEELATRVLTLVAASRDLAPDEVHLDDTLQSLGFDSLDGLDLFFDIEEAFDVKIPDDVARQIVTVRHIAERLVTIGTAAPPEEAV
jgi:acyl carrier protein